MNKKAQAAIELAVFGAILVFVLGTIVRSAVGNGYAQNQNFKAMRMAMLASWNSSKAANMSRTSASVLFVEDRLSPDFNKYGDLDRSPSIAQGAGTFSFEVLYPLTPGQDNIQANMPIMDVYINGLHFPFTTAAYVKNRVIQRPACPPQGPYPPPSDGGLLSQAQCLQNQCLRNQREWAGGTVNESQFKTIVPVPLPWNSTTDATMAANAHAIFNELANEGNISPIGTQEAVVNSSTLSGAFAVWLESTFPGTGQAQVNQIQSILQGEQHQYKLFYTMQVNGTPQFSPMPPGTCSSSSNTSNELCATLTVVDASGNAYTNTNGDMQYDLLRLGNYTFPLGSYPAVNSQFPPVASCSDLSVAPNMRCYVAWQWSASAATSASSIGLDPNNNQYPTFDIDGRLKEVTIYGFSQNSDGTPTVTYEDPSGGDIDGTWDRNSCGPKPGLQNNSQVYTFTKQGTYLQIKEGKLYNPETGQFVRSANKRDTVDVIQRVIQLSNNTGRFCDQSGIPLTTVANDGATPNPVEVCIPLGSSDNCFSSEQNIKSTCFDENDNIIFVRSRLQDRRGHFWITDASGQLQVK